MSERLYCINPSTARTEVVGDIISDFGGHAQSHPVNRGMTDNELLNIMYEFTDSREFRVRYSERDRQLAIRAFVACEQGRTWKYGRRADTEEDTLFTASVPAATKTATLVDGLVLSGALGWHDDEDKDLIDYSKQEKIALPDIYRLVGAANLTINPSVLERGEYTHEVDGIRTTQYVGADMHGDFRIRRMVSAGGPVLAPSGELVDFSPILEHQQAGAYHSSEMRVVAAMLAQLFRDQSEEQKTVIKAALLATLAQAHDSSVVLFGDFGDEASHVKRYAAKYRDTVKTGDVLAKNLMVSPDSPLNLSIISSPTSVQFITTRSDTPHASNDASRLDIPNDEIPDFIVALCSAAQGRVSVASIKELIAIL